VLGILTWWISVYVTSPLTGGRDMTGVTDRVKWPKRSGQTTVQHYNVKLLK